jgi:hypothetical protein
VPTAARICTPCGNAFQNERQKKYWAAHPEIRPKQKAMNRRVTLKRYHGITVEFYESLLNAQNGVCKICGGPQTHGRKNLDVDHCHNSLIIRGLLCSHCNRSIGLMGDDPARLRAAADYIENSRTTVKWEPGPGRKPAKVYVLGERADTHQAAG